MFLLGQGPGVGMGGDYNADKKRVLKRKSRMRVTYV